MDSFKLITNRLTCNLSPKEHLFQCAVELPCGGYACKNCMQLNNGKEIYCKNCQNYHNTSVREDVRLNEHVSTTERGEKLKNFINSHLDKLMAYMSRKYDQVRENFNSKQKFSILKFFTFFVQILNKHFKMVNFMIPLLT